MAEKQIPNSIRKVKAHNVAAASLNADGINSKISTLFFDLDNTLIPTRSGDSKAIRKLAEVLENQFAFTKDESTLATHTFLKSFRRCTDNSQTSLDSWRTYLWREALPARYKHLAEQIYPKWLKLRYRYLALQPEYVQLLRRFRESGYLLAVITNGPSNAQWEKIQKLNVSQYFDCILVSSDLPWEKPHPNIFFAACNYLGVKPAECAMIGDKLETDIKGGRIVGLGVTFWLPLNPTETDLTDVTHPPDIILRNLLEMYKYFPNLNANSGGGSGFGANFSTTQTTTATTSSLATSTSSQSRRRGSQISCSATKSTCDNDRDLYCQQHQQTQRHAQIQQQQNRNNQGYNKYRRGGSLPAIECLNSEAENSSDSLFS